MIQLTRINHNPVVVNSDLMEHIEANPDTVITLTTGQKLMVLETPEQIIDLVICFRRRIAAQDLLEPHRPTSARVSHHQEPEHGTENEQ